MPEPLSIVFRGMARKVDLERVIGRRFDELRRRVGGIVSGRVLIETAGRHRRHGNTMHVRVSIALAGRTIVVDHRVSLQSDARGDGRPPRKRDEPAAVSRDASVAVRHALDAAERRVEGFGQRRRGAVRRHVRALRIPPRAA